MRLTQPGGGVGGEKEPSEKASQRGQHPLDWDEEVLPYFAFSSELKVIVDPDTVCVLVALCDPMDCSMLGSSVHGIFQARIQG